MSTQPGPVPPSPPTPPPWTAEFESNVRRYARAVAKKSGIPRASFDDVEQAACLAAWKNYAAHHDNPRYLMRCVRNSVVDVARYNSRRRIGEELPLFEFGHVDWDAARAMDDDASAALVVAQLTETERQLVGHLVVGRQHAEIREELGWSEDFFKSVLGTIRRKTANLLCLEYYDDVD
jgi:DNA-directed RNA polymerase specialized sigma24 family protein